MKVRSLGHILPSVKVGWKTGSKLEDLDDLMLHSPDDLFKPWNDVKEFYVAGTFKVGDKVERYDFEREEGDEEDEALAEQRYADWWKGEIVALEGHDGPNRGKAQVRFPCEDNSEIKAWYPIDILLRLEGEEELFKAIAFVHITTQKP